MFKLTSPFLQSLPQELQLLHQDDPERDIVKATEYKEPAGRRGEGRPRTLTSSSRNYSIAQDLGEVRPCKLVQIHMNEP